MKSPHPSYEHLEELADRNTSGLPAERVRRHVESCRECRTWVDTYRLVAAATGSPVDRGADHPSSKRLADYAVDPGRLGDSERERVNEHLESCRPCRESARLAAEAVSAARWERASPVPLAETRPLAAHFALAASLVLLVGLAWVLRPEPVSTVGTEVVAAEELSHESLSGSHLIEATGSITADWVTLETGSDVTFRAGEVVVLSDGFAVGSGASFQVEIGPPTGREAS
jgi:hypothetical protein